MNQNQPAAYLNDLHQLLVRTCNAQELATLCFRLGIAYDDLGGQGRSDKARELVLLLDRTSRLDELPEALTVMRPNADHLPPAAATPDETGETPPSRPRFAIDAGEMKVGRLVQGVYQEGGTPVDWSALLPHLPDADIQADSLDIEQMTQGVHIQAGPGMLLPPEPLLQALRTQVDGLGVSTADQQDIDAALQAVSAELGKAAPNQRRMLARLDEAAAVVQPVAGTPTGHAFLAQLLVLRQAVMNS